MFHIPRDELLLLSIKHDFMLTIINNQSINALMPWSTNLRICYSCWWLVEATSTICFVDYIVAHVLNRFCMCFGYVPRSSNFGDNTILIQIFLGVQHCGVSFMERLWSMKLCMLLMFFVFLMKTSLSPHFLLLFNGSELKIWLFGILLRHWLFG